MRALPAKREVEHDGIEQLQPLGFGFRVRERVEIWNWRRRQRLVSECGTQVSQQLASPPQQRTSLLVFSPAVVGLATDGCVEQPQEDALLGAVLCTGVGETVVHRRMCRVGEGSAKRTRASFSPRRENLAMASLIGSHGSDARLVISGSSAHAESAT